MIWEQFRLTNTGITQRQIHIAETGNLNGRRLRFGIAKLGSGKPSSPSDIATMTDLVTPVTEGKIKKNYAEDVNHLMVAEVTNKEITTKEFISEIGIFSRLATKDEPPDTDYSAYTLYGITYTESDPITLDPPSSVNGFELFDVGIQNTLGNAAEVQLNYSTTTVFVTHKDMDDHNLNPAAHPDKVTGSWAIFDSLEKLGITAGTETLKQIVTTMPEKSTLYAIISSANNPSQYPKPEGFLTVVKHTNNRIDLEFNNSPYTLAHWAGMAYYTEGSDYWSGWEPVISGRKFAEGVIEVFVANNGTDGLMFGDKENPYQTLEYALKRVNDYIGHFRYVVTIKAGTYNVPNISVMFATCPIVIRSENNNPSEVILNIAVGGQLYFAVCAFTAILGVTINGNTISNNWVVRFDINSGSIQDCIINGTNQTNKCGVYIASESLDIAYTTLNNCYIAIGAYRGSCACRVIKGSGNTIAFLSETSNLIHSSSAITATTRESRVDGGLINGT